MRWRFEAGGLAGLLLAMLALAAGCTVVVEEPAPIQPGPAYCSREYVPVCARRSGERRTFPNACVAERAGFDVIRFGECRDEGGGRPEFCTREYAPVCARRRGEYRTFPNACEARAADWRIVDEGRC